MFCKGYTIIIYIILINITTNKCNVQIGPEPWDYVNNIKSATTDDNVPPDLKLKPQKTEQSNINIGMGEWFYKRILSIVLKGGQIKKNEDGSIDVSLHMKYNNERWNILDDYLKSNTPHSEDMYRRSTGYIEEAIIKPTISDKIVLAWSEYFQYYLTEYKAYIMWATSIIAGIITIFWIWNHISHKHIVIITVIALYLYEVLISYKEAEKQELDRFITAVNTCKWYIWTSECEVPPPDPLIFLKHMNPLKIAIRMFTTLISEPMITISETIKIIIHGVTDGLWFPFNKIMYGILVLTFTALVILLLIIIIFNYILNIPFKLSLFGIISVGLQQRFRTVPNVSTNEHRIQPRIDSGDMISGENLTKLLDVYSRALNTATSRITRKDALQNSNLSITYKSKMSRSASTGRLPNYTCDSSDIKGNFCNNDIRHRYKQSGSGDAN